MQRENNVLITTNDERAKKIKKKKEKTNDRIEGVSTTKTRMINKWDTLFLLLHQPDRLKVTLKRTTKNRT